MLLAIDVGNTLTKFSVFDGECLISSFKIRSDTRQSEDEQRLVLLSFLNSLDEKIKLSKVIISSVVPPLTHIWASISKKCLKIRPHIMGPGLKCGIPIKVDDPSSVGSDLIADAVGALKLYGAPCLIVDMGTATKYILLDKDGCFGGVAIAPGFGISMDSLVNKTSALPEVSAIAPKKVIGRNTNDSMNSGIVYGTVYQIRGFAESIEKECGYPLKKILTGGYAKFVSKHLPEFIWDEDVLMIGLHEIEERN